MSSKILGPEVGITDLIHHSIIERAEIEEGKVREGVAEKSPFRPSSAGECERALAYKGTEYLGKAYYEKPPIEPHVQLIFALGHAIEAMLIKVFESVEFFKIKYPQQVLSFFKINSGNERLDTLMEGSNDLCMVGTTDGWKGVIDVKSKATGIGTYKRTKWDELDDKLRKMNSVQVISNTSYWIEDPMKFIKEINDPFMAMNLWQLNLYCLSEFMQERGFDFCSLIYFSKDNSAIREIRFKPSKLLYELTEKRFQNAAKAAAKNNPSLAKQEFLLGSTKCAYCPYVKPCWGVNEDVALKESFKNLPKKDWPKNLLKEDPEMSNTLIEYHKSEEDMKVRKQLEQGIMEYMVENKLDKVQTTIDNERIVYELRRFKTTMSLKRSRL